MSKRGGETREGERILGKECCMVVGREHEEHEGLKEMGVTGGQGWQGRSAGAMPRGLAGPPLRSSALS